MAIIADRARSAAGPPRRASARSSGLRTARRRRYRRRPAVGRGRSPRRLAEKARLHGSICEGWIRLLPSKPSARPSAHWAVKPSRSSRSLNTPSNTGTPAARAASTVACSAICSGCRPASAGRRRSAERSLVPAISASRFGRDFRGGQHPGRGLDHRQRRLADRVPHRLEQVRGGGPGKHREVRRGSRHRLDVERMPFAADRIHADRHRHRPFACDRLKRGGASVGLVLRLHRIFEVEHDHVGGRSPRLLDRPRVRRRQEQHRPYGEQVGRHVDFPSARALPSHHAGQGRDGEWKC